MVFYKNLYLADGCREKKRKICWKLKHNAGQINIFIVGLAAGEDLLEIYHCAFLQQKAFRKKAPLIVGLADSHEEAVALTQRIIMDTLTDTGGLRVKEYILHRQEQKGAR